MPVAFDGRPTSSELDGTMVSSLGSVSGRFVMAGSVVADGVGVKDSTVKLVDIVGDTCAE